MVGLEEPMLLGHAIEEQFDNDRVTYAHRIGVVHDGIDQEIVQFADTVITPTSRILEVGGGSGYMLELIARRKKVSEIVNCEYVTEPYRNQVACEARLVRGNVLDLPFQDASFDFTLMKNVLHHLVSDSVSGTIRNKRRALRELCRVTRPQGHVAVFELCYRIGPFNSFLYHALRTASTLGIKAPRLGINRGTIVLFSSPGGFRRLIGDFIEPRTTTTACHKSGAQSRYLSAASMTCAWILIIGSPRAIVDTW